MGFGLKDFKNKAGIGGNGPKNSINHSSDNSLETNKPEMTAEELYEKGLDFYSGRNGNRQDYEQAFYCFSAAADKGDHFANGVLGIMYRDGLFVEQNMSKAKRLFQLAADNDVPFAITDLGLLYLDEDKTKEAFNLFLRAAELNSGTACWKVGQFYNFGIEENRDYDKAERYYLKAADLEEERSYYDLGKLYEDKEDSKSAFLWYKKSADAGYYAGMCGVGWAYLLGDGVEQDGSTAKLWLEKSCEGDYADAQFGLGLIYEYGEGVVANINKAMDLYRKAAEQGHENAGIAVQYGGWGNRPQKNESSSGSSSSVSISQGDIASIVKEIIADKLGVELDEVTPDASFYDDLGADSLDGVELVMEFEKQFNVCIPERDAERIRTVGDAISYLERNT